MDLVTYFSTLCRQAGVHFNGEGPAIKPLITGKKNKHKNGVVARFNFGEFNMDIYYIENMKGGFQQVLWTSFFFEKEPRITFSVYDILSVTDPENFNCYTYSFVDSKELMKTCMDEIMVLLTELLPKLTAIAANGVERNKLIDLQKQKVNAYFGDNIIEASEQLKQSAEKILVMMFYNFFQYQIDVYLAGTPALFYKGKEEKALKALKKAKYRTLYEDNLLTYLENGGKAPKLTEASEAATVKKGTSRQGTDAKGSLKTFLYTVLFSVPVLLVLTGLFFALTYLTAGDYKFIFGIKESLILLPIFAFLPALAITMNINARRKSKNKDIHIPTLPPKAKNALKYLTIFAESFAIIGVFICANVTLTMNDNGIIYSTEDLPLSKESIQYSTIDYAAIVEGYTYKGEFQEDKHVVLVTKSGIVIDLYNSTCFSADEFKEKAEGFLNEKGIEIKSFKTID